MGSSSVTKAPPPNAPSSYSSTELLDGLKFGQKIYFEDVGLGSPAKSRAGGASFASSSGTKKGRGGAVQGAQSPRCQVEGCTVDLSDAKAYYSRHKVCGMHSKSPRVIVAGLEQRFCQQCSRFHQLPEFDQEKRSCRRRLAGHNERRRKPQPSSLLTSPYSRLSSPVFDKSGRVDGFLMEFAAYRKLTLRNASSTPRSSEQVPGNQTSTLPWQSSLETPSELFLRGSVGGISYLGPRSPPGESFTGITDTSCALSLLSNQTWGPGHRAPNRGLNNLYYGGTPLTQLAASSSDVAIHELSNASWCFKGIEAGNCSHEVVPDLGLGQIAQPPANQLPDELLVPQSDQRQYMDLEQSRVYKSSQLMHWSL